MFSKLQVKQVLGHGAYSTVYLCSTKNSPNSTETAIQNNLLQTSNYALKRIILPKNQKKEKFPHQLESQFKILSNLSHPNILNYYAIRRTISSVDLVLEYAPNGTLLQYLHDTKRSNKTVSSHLAWKWLLQLLSSLQYLHRRGFIHRDVKCENILLDKNNDIKLADFNTIRWIRNGMAETRVGTPYYYSPQIWNNQQYNSKCDTWALGCVLHQILYLQRAFIGRDAFEVKKNALEANYSFQKLQNSIQQNEIESRNLNNLMIWMLTVNQQQRPTMSQILKKDIVNTKLNDLQQQNLLSSQFLVVTQHNMTQIGQQTEEKMKLIIPIRNDRVPKILFSKKQRRLSERQKTISKIYSTKLALSKIKSRQRSQSFRQKTVSKKKNNIAQSENKENIEQKKLEYGIGSLETKRKQIRKNQK